MIVSKFDNLAIQKTIFQKTIFEQSNDKKLLVVVGANRRMTPYVDIVEAYTLRWIVEVFFQDWKTNEGWATMTKLTGKDGSRHGLILSLLVDHCLLLHPDQLARIENKLPACTVGSLRSQISMESLFIFIQELIASEEPAKELEQLIKRLKETVMSLAPSQKHMVGRELGRLEPTPYLKYRAAA